MDKEENGCLRVVVVIAKLTEVCCLSTAPDPTASAALIPGPRESPVPSLQPNPAPRSPVLVLAPASHAVALGAASHAPRVIQSPALSVALAATPRRSQ